MLLDILSVLITLHTNMLHTHKTGIAVAALAVAGHVAWSIVVVLGFGQWWVDFILGLHFMQVPVTILPFNFVTAVELWVVVAIVGYVLGYIFATIWNRVQK